MLHSKVSLRFESIEKEEGIALLKSETLYMSSNVWRSKLSFQYNWISRMANTSSEPMSVALWYVKNCQHTCTKMRSVDIRVWYVRGETSSIWIYTLNELSMLRCGSLLGICPWNLPVEFAGELLKYANFKNIYGKTFNCVRFREKTWKDFRFLFKANASFLRVYIHVTFWQRFG